MLNFYAFMWMSFFSSWPCNKIKRLVGGGAVVCVHESAREMM
jgi:hypothetical protein